MEEKKEDFSAFEKEIASAPAPEPAAQPAPVPAPEPALQPAPAPKPKRDFTMKAWLALVSVLFILSSVCAVYIIITGGIKKQDVITEPAKSTSSLFTSLKKESDETGVAVIRIRGVIMEDTGSSWGATPSASSIARRIRDAAEKDTVKAIILDIDSPGGTVASVQEIYNEILRARNVSNKKVVAMFRDVAASGGFYVAMAADKVIAQPGTITGSIGVIMQTGNYEGLMGKIGVKFDSIKSGKHKDMGSPFRPMTEEERTLLQSMIDDSYDQFFEVVKAARTSINPMNLKVYADGRVFTGRQAFSVGLIDGLGGEDEALALARELTGIADLKIIRQRNDPFRNFFVTLDSFGYKSPVKELQSAAEPKVAYLWTI